MNVRVDAITQRFSTRESGAAARQAVLRALQGERGRLILDFEGVEPSPSFADEFVGRLAEELGERAFRMHVGFANLDEATQLLLQTVVARRLRRAAHHLLDYA